MKRIHILLTLGLTLLFTACHYNPSFNEEELKSFLKDKAGITVEDSLAIINFVCPNVIERDYYETYNIKCSKRDHKNILNHAIQNGWKDLKGGFLLVIPETFVSFSDTVFMFSVRDDKPEISITIADE